MHRASLVLPGKDSSSPSSAHLFFALSLPRDWSSEAFDETLHPGCPSRAARPPFLGCPVGNRTHDLCTEIICVSHLATPPPYLTTIFCCWDTQLQFTREKTKSDITGVNEYVNLWCLSCLIGLDVHNVTYSRHQKYSARFSKVPHLLRTIVT